MMGDSDNLVEFPKDPDAVEISMGRWRPRQPGQCRHLRVELAEHGGQRRVYCVTCDETLDPYETLVRYARVDDKLRRQAKAWKGLAEAWAWICDNRASLTISRAQGVRISLEINGKRRSRKAHVAERDGLPSLILGAIDAAKQLKRWGV